jgi:DNA-binding cell septation regulator SpoVG
MSEIIVISVKKIEGKEQLRAFADVGIGEITINGLRLMEDPKGYWIGPPQNTYKDKSGKTKYSLIVEFSEGLKKKIKEAVVHEFKKN